MGATPSRSSMNDLIAASQSDDEFVDCEDSFDDDKLISGSDEIVIHSKPLESSTKKSDDDVVATRSQPEKNSLDSKQIESDGDDEDENESVDERKARQRKEMDEFREEMNKKRELRQQCIKKLREELSELRERLSSEVSANLELREALEASNSFSSSKSLDDLSNENKKLKVELAECQMFLQSSNSENITMTMENKALRDQVRSLKEAINAIKEMLKIRECQVDQMKSKLSEIEASFSERETKILSSALQQEYHRQLENIRNMRELYEERANILLEEKESYKRKFEEKEHDLKTEIEKSKNLEEYISTLENNVKLKNSDIGHLESEIGMLKSEKAQVASEMSAVNQLIAQALFGFNGNGDQIDIDKLVNMLEQNRDLLNEMAIKEDYAGIDEGSFLPKLLYDLFIQVNHVSNDEITNNVISSASGSTPEEIAEKLPKVWRVLIELLNHHKKLNDDEERVLDDCYKSVQTTAGPQNVLSVSKTFIKLKDLILEKRSLQKDTNRLKTLYGHLEQRLDKQEKRLSTVSLELTKTWHLVGKIKRQHRQLHTHEQILCYQLQQKKRVLNELKAELEYCRKKWALARALNNDSEEQCKQLRHEFSLRKAQDQNSAESGYSDEQQSDGDDDAGSTTIIISKVKKFDDNLNKFDRTTSPSFLERRQSESPVIQDFTHLYGISRSQSEPPPPTSSASILNETDRSTIEESCEVLEFVPEDSLEHCSGSLSEEPFESHDDGDDNVIVISPPPEVHVYNKKSNTTKLKAHSRKHKKDKKKKSNENSNCKTETAEEMYLRLMRGNKSDYSSTCSSTMSYEEDGEDIEEIQEIPMDEPASSSVIVESLTTSTDIEQTDEVQVNETVTTIDPQPSTSAEAQEEINSDDLSILTAKEQDYLQRREARLSRLEAEAQDFYNRMARNKEKGQKLDDHINDIHNTFKERNRERTKSEEEKISNESTSNAVDVDVKKSDEKSQKPETNEHDEDDGK